MTHMMTGQVPSYGSTRLVCLLNVLHEGTGAELPATELATFGLECMPMGDSQLSECEMESVGLVPVSTGEIRNHYRHSAIGT